MRVLPLVVSLAFIPIAALAQTGRAAEAVLDALRLPQLLAIMQLEAVDSGRELLESMAPDRDSAGWARLVGRINDPAALAPDMQEVFSRTLPPEHLDAILAYWRSPEGEKIVGLELSAREAMLDPDVEDTVLDQFKGVASEDSPRAELLRTFVEVNDLIDSNIVGTMNANAAFLRALQQGGAKDSVGRLRDDEIMSEVWRQEPEIRATTETWLYAFASLAYQPMSDAELQSYIDFSQSDAGQAFNVALFNAFDRVFVATSDETGAALARFLASEEL